MGIDNLEDADAQIIQADAYIKRLTGGLATPLVAYPYGEATDYLLPQQYEAAWNGCSVFNGRRVCHV